MKLDIVGHGILLDQVDDNTLDQWKEIYQKNTITKTHSGDDCWGIDKKCMAYGWFCKQVMPTIAKTFDPGIKLIFSSFIDLKTPLDIHTDLKPLPEGTTGRHYMSILVPYSIDNEKQDISRASTCFYDQNNQLIEKVDWQKNSLLWWDSSILHNSGGFDQFESKQYFITHTYI